MRKMILKKGKQKEKQTKANKYLFRQSYKFYLYNHIRFFNSDLTSEYFFSCTRFSTKLTFLRKYILTSNGVQLMEIRFIKRYFFSLILDSTRSRF